MSNQVWSKLSRDEKVGAIYRLSRKNKTASEIAEALGTKAQHIHAIARDEGIVIVKVRELSTYPSKDDDGLGESISLDPWQRGEDARRMANWRKQVQGAREARQSLRKAHA